MGGRGSGNHKPDRKRQAAALPAKGLSLAEIGRRLGCSKQAVDGLLRRAKGARAPEHVTCRACGAVLCAARQGMWTVRYALCLTCLSPDAGFGRRVLAFRLARGLTAQELAERLGEKLDTIREWEQRREQQQDIRLRWRQWVRLVQFFGPGFVPPERGA
jgi:transcriptional regulator with XRE-family HTH domain